jgi:phage FluMu protein Com
MADPLVCQDCRKPFVATAAESIEEVRCPRCRQASTVAGGESSLQQPFIQPTSSQAAAVDRPSSLLRSVFGTQLGLAVLLFGCMFLPFSKGCSDQVNYPVEFVTRLASEDDREISRLSSLLPIWPFAFGLVHCLLLTRVVLTRRIKHCREVWIALAVIGTVISSGYLLDIQRIAKMMAADTASNESTDVDGSTIDDQSVEEMDMSYVATLVLAVISHLFFPLLFFSAVILTYFNCRTWYSAVAWMMLLMSLWGSAWFVSPIMPLNILSSWLIGFWLSMSCLVCLALTSLWMIRRSRQADYLHRLGTPRSITTTSPHVPRQDRSRSG